MAQEELKKLRKAVEASGEVILMTDRDGMITYVNPEFTKLYGYKDEEVIGKTTPRILKSGQMSRQDYELLWEKLLDKQVVKLELVNRCKDGKLVTIESSANPILDDTGQITGFLAIQRDITKRKQAEEEIRLRNIELAALNAIASTVSQSLDLDQIINDALDEVLKLEMLVDGAYGMLFLLDENQSTLYLAAQRGAPKNHPCLTNPQKVGECLCGLAAQRGEVIISDGCLEDERHTRIWPNMHNHKDISLPLMVRGRILGAMDVRLPITYEVADSDVELLKSVANQISLAIENAQLRELRERAILEERERIARELHDGFSQLLGYVNTKAMAVRLMLKNGQIDTADQHLYQLEEAARGLFVDVRSAILDLKMAGQSGSGLTTNLNEYAAQFSLLSGLPVEISIDPGVEYLQLKAETELQLIRIVQEALANIRKHASATKAWVNVNSNNGDLEISIGDNGIGFQPEAFKGNDSSRFGLSMMRERAEAIGAFLEVDSAPNKGTQIIVRLKAKEGRENARPGS